MMGLNMKNLTTHLKNSSIYFIKSGVSAFGWMVFDSSLKIHPDSRIILMLAAFFFLVTVYVFFRALIELAFFTFNVKIV